MTNPIRTAEQMLETYIQQGKRPLAELALETLLELVPDHPRADDYRQWVAEIDQEVAERSRVDGSATAVRAAISQGNLPAARQALAALEQLDPDAASAVAMELTHAEQAHAATATIAERKHRIDMLLIQGEVNQAETEIDALAALEVPKVTLDFLRQRLDDRRSALRSEAELRSLESVFTQHVGRRHWQSARDVARVVAEQFGDLERATRMLSEIDRHEAGERRQRSIQQGIDALERFLQAGDRQQAELALRVLRGLSVADSDLEPYRRRLEMI